MWPAAILPLRRRQFLTRVLCGVTIASAGVGLALWLASFALLFLSSRLAMPVMLWAGGAIVIYTCCSLLLWAWRSCDRCSFHLYPFLSGVALDGKVRRSLTEAKFPDYRAERQLGSFRWGAYLSMARGGVTHCMWCGHADGAPVTRE